ncbi:hypothetical protein Sjap_002883 [Stephania japonica]|uniref:F-box domain-containing protein n=1 Tax=Stephania japonica TaxID=461633 RepID=A0AAP0KP82_9MAGN
MGTLPHELYSSILQRLPAKMLLRFRAVSKLWRDNIDDPTLALAQLSLAVEEAMLIAILRPREEIKCSYIVEEIGLKGRSESLISIRNGAIGSFQMARLSSLVNSCNGLLCFSNHGCDHHYTLEGVIAEIFVCNPLMQDLRILPPLPPNQTLGFGFSPSAKAFNVVGVSENFKFLEAKVCTLGFGTKVWKLISSAPPYPIYGKPAYANGVLYWKIDDQCETPNGERIVCFDVGEEVFRIADMLGCVDRNNSPTLESKTSN